MPVSPPIPPIVIPSEGAIVIPSEGAIVIPSEGFSPSRGTFCFPLRTAASAAVRRFPLRSLASFAVGRLSIDNQKSKIKNGFRFPFCRLLCCLVTVFTLTLTSSATVPQSAPTEYEVKAAYLYNFGKFVKWSPNSIDPSLDICVLGDNPFGDSLRSMVTGENIAGKPAHVRQLDTVRDTAGCNILFISRSEARRLRTILASVDTKPMLTVSDIPGFTDAGGMIGFVNERGRVRFNINLAAAHRAGLNLSSELLKVASSVKGKP